ncbi:Phytoene/squalene synthetase [Monaibacterium marinum]|uniref:Phytoene/squalene synthetase n=1 Tax=Pontivivens marinum TaxID=1690039 RepID=A0A2C9CM80_9RHOB|nr:squalene/phytoene synthase family protein [Monaibacterium marinum]SOH92295.1 Phytoene/squalene synthetase [Monaibacterium marinum]
MSWHDCASLVEKADPDRFLSAMTAPEEGRAALFPLYAFNAEVARAPWVTSEPALAEIRLQWWRDAIAEIYAGNTPRRHEVVEPLAEIIRSANLPRWPFEALIDARVFDIYADGHLGRPAFDAYLDATSGGLMRLAVMACGDDAAELSGHIGWAQGAAGLIRALPALWAAGRDPLPIAGDLPRQELLNGKMPDAAADAIRAVAQDGLQRLANAQRAAISDSAKAALRAGWRSQATLQAVARDPAAIFSGLETSEFRRKGGLLLRTMTGRW